MKFYTEQELQQVLNNKDTVYKMEKLLHYDSYIPVAELNGNAYLISKEEYELGINRTKHGETN